MSIESSELSEPRNEISPPQADRPALSPMSAQARGKPESDTLGHDAGPPGPICEKVLGGYRLTRELGRGGQAVVYEGVQKTTGRRVAVKVLHGGGFVSVADRGRFEREVQVLAALNHPTIVQIVDRGETSDGSLYLVMDLISGRPLDQHLDAYYERLKQDPPPTDPSEVLRLFLRIADGVNAAHLRGIVHRDLKPSNILVDERGEPHIMDFGLARAGLAGVAGDREPLTVRGSFMGSLPWASPEQAEGDPDRVDVRTDVYALGIILYQMLTRKFPYKVVGPLRDVLNNIINSQPLPPSQAVLVAQAAEHRKSWRWPRARQGINPLLEAIILKALAKKREDRYQSAGELARDIGNYLSGRPATVGVAGGFTPWRSATVVLAAVLVAALVTLASLLSGQLGSAPPDGPGQPNTPPGVGPRSDPPQSPVVIAGRAVAGNTAPALHNSADLSPLVENSKSNPGTLVRDLIAGRLSDPNGPREGIAIVGVNDNWGRWQYTINGKDWHNIGPVSGDRARALLADQDTRVRFVPVPDRSGALAGLTFRSWDQADTQVPEGALVDASRTGGSTTFSDQTATASITVEAVNNAPKLTGVNDLDPIGADDTDNPGTLVAALLTGKVQDPDGPREGMVIVAVNNADGTWEYSLDGIRWRSIVNASPTSGLSILADEDNRVRFIPKAGFRGKVSGLTFHAWDQAGNRKDEAVPMPMEAVGGINACSAETATASVTVGEPNDREER